MDSLWEDQGSYSIVMLTNSSTSSYLFALVTWKLNIGGSVLLFPYKQFRLHLVDCGKDSLRGFKL